MTTDWRDAGTEARALAGPDARVLEPSPPAIHEEPWYADDPASPAFAWEAHPEHRAWAERRFLTGNPPLGAPPEGLAATRLSWHLLAAYVVSPARRAANGKIALRWVLDGVGTPFFGADEQLRIVGDRLVRQQAGTATSAPITTLDAAAAFAGIGEPDREWAARFDVPPARDDLPVDPEAAAWLARWFGLGNAALEAIRAAHPQGGTTLVQLWPEHFDLAVTLADVTYGVSPGDDAHPEPYLYVLPGWPDKVVGAAEIAAAANPRAAIDAWFARMAP